jgi:2-oxoglutarate dehydrogenase E2 component (dihydrolipoamide succinyltransferase)
MQVKMPQLGETVVEGTILKWLKQEGEEVAQDEPLFEISTDKVDTEVPSPAAGTLSKILVAEGQTVSVGTDLATIDSGDGEAGDGDAPAAAARPEAATQSPPPTEAPAGQAVGTPVQVSAPVESPQVEPAAAVPAARRPPPEAPLRRSPTGDRAPRSSRRSSAGSRPSTASISRRWRAPARAAGSRRTT